MTRRIKVPHSTKERFFCHHIVFRVWFGVAFEEKVIRTTSISCSNGVFRTKKTLGLELLGYKPKVCIKKIILAALGSIEQVILYHCSTRYL